MCDQHNLDGNLNFKTPDNTKPMHVIPLCNSCIQRYRYLEPEDQPKPINLRDLVRTDIADQARDKKYVSLHEKTVFYLKMMAETENLELPHFCSACLTKHEPKNMEIFFKTTGDPTEFYMVCPDCLSGSYMNVQDWTDAKCRKFDDEYEDFFSYTIFDLREKRLPDFIEESNQFVSAELKIKPSDVYNTS